MFLTNKRNGYDRNGEQVASGKFLILASSNRFTDKDADPLALYACVRHVSYRQLGHFMMGRARIAGKTVILSGAYGSDGLPIDYSELPDTAKAKFVRVPDDIADIFWHSSEGEETSHMREYGKSLL